MATFALIDNENRVVTTLAADTIDGPKSVFPNAKIVLVLENTLVQQNSIYDELTGTFSEPIVEETPSEPIVEETPTE
jgi:hypothetical protein